MKGRPLPGNLSAMRRVPVPKPDAPYHDVETAKLIAGILGEPPFGIRGTHRHNGTVMVPPSALEATSFWESCHGDNVPILTEAEIARLRKHNGLGGC